MKLIRIYDERLSRRKTKVDFGEFILRSPKLKKREKCSCGKMTKNALMGYAECKKCFNARFHCFVCKNGIERSTFQSNGNDLEDHFSHWTACGIRKYDQELKIVISNYNKDSMISSYNIDNRDKRNCYVPDPVKLKLKKKKMKEIKKVRMKNTFKRIQLKIKNKLEKIKNKLESLKYVYQDPSEFFDESEYEDSYKTRSEFDEEDSYSGDYYEC
jgi:hypothetical protein